MTLRYLYCAVASGSPPELSGWRGEGAPLALVVADGVAGVVGHVSAERYGAPALERATGAVETLAPYAAAHQSVVQFVFERAPAVVPFAFGSVHRTEADVRHSLETRREELELLLRRFTGMQEWSLRATRLARARVPAASGTAYLEQRRAELRGEVDARAASVLQRLDADLGEGAAGRVVLDERAGDLLLRVGYLVPAASAARLGRIVIGAGPSLEEHGVAVELSGPWPPYSFVRQ